MRSWLLWQYGLNLSTLEGDFFSYSGSLTTPPCNPVVRWIVFKNTIKISEAQAINHHSIINCNECLLVERVPEIEEPTWNGTVEQSQTGPATQWEKSAALPVVAVFLILLYSIHLLETYITLNMEKATDMLYLKRHKICPFFFLVKVFLHGHW